MSWFTQDFALVPFVEDVFETRDIKQSGEKMFGGLAAKLKEIADDPGKVKELAAVLEEKKYELTGAIIARTPAAGLLPAEYMPPGSVDTTQEQVEIPGTAAGATGPVEQAAAEEEYEYDDSEDEGEDEGEDVLDEQNEKPKAKKKKKK